jgi:hypothetical protein
MTINKIGLSVVAATLVATASIAGTITATSGKLGTERLSLNDVNVTTITSTAVAAYTPSSIPAGSLKNPIFKYSFANVSGLTAGAALGVYLAVDGNETNATAANNVLVAATPTVSGSNSEVITFNSVDANTYVYNNKKYVLRDANNTNTATLTAKVTKGSTSPVTLTGALYSGDSQALNDSSLATTLYSIGAEYSATISTKFDARIDAANTFFKFYDQNSDGVTKLADNMILKIVKDATVVAAGQLGVASRNLVVFSDQNLTANATGGTTSAASLGAITVNDKNVTATIAAADANSDLILTVNGTSKVEKTSFGAEISLTSTAAVSAATKFTLESSTGTNAGAWTIYGYTAQIPNVSGLSTHDTTMKFTNRSDLNTNIYFTLVDPDGTVASLDSVTNTSLASLNKNTTGTYRASDLLALITDANFDKSGSFSVEIAIPTTPDSVYGMASFKNTTLGQFKDLPVYNSSSMNY